MSRNSTATATKGEQVLDELREFFIAYLQTPGSMSLRGLAKKVGVSHVTLHRFQEGGGIGFDIGIQLALAIGFNLQKFLNTVP
jgi:plasmid maintenance system antidote protein VapI